MCWDKQVIYSHDALFEWNSNFIHASGLIGFYAICVDVFLRIFLSFGGKPTSLLNNNFVYQTSSVPSTALPTLKENESVQFVASCSSWWLNLNTSHSECFYLGADWRWPRAAGARWKFSELHQPSWKWCPEDGGAYCRKDPVLQGRGHVRGQSSECSL